MRGLRTVLAALAMAALLFATGCGKEEAEEKEPATTYGLRVSNDFPAFPDGVSVTNYCIEYNGTAERVAEHASDFKRGAYARYEADKNAVKVKVYMIGKIRGETVFHKWVQQVYHLEKGHYRELKIDGSTRLGNSEP